MTPEERQLLDRFLQDLAQARPGPKDAEAERLINDAFAHNTDSPYLLVQHAVLADQSLHAAQARISELEQQLQSTGQQTGGSSFLGGGWRQPQPQTAVPQSAPQPAYDPGPPPSYAAAPGPFSMNGGLGSFLRNAGTTAAGVAGGEMLFQGLSGLFGGHRGMFGGGWGGGWPGGGGGWGGGGPVEETIVNNNYYDDDDGGFGTDF
jgi:uncharacterized protein